MRCERYHRRHIALPLFLIMIGVMRLAGEAGVIRSVSLGHMWPLLLIAFGLDQIWAWTRSGEYR